MESGQFIGSFACYGYKKDENDKHKIIIDEEAAKVVKKIFYMYQNGYSVKLIADKLSLEKIPTPCAYKKMMGYKYKNPISNSYSQSLGIWSSTTILRILSNETYIGTLVQGRERKLSYKSKKITLVPKEEWIKVPNNHEPIINYKQFEDVQKIRISRRKNIVSKHKNVKGDWNCFVGKIFCADCGYSMVKSSSKSNRKKESIITDYLRCSLSNKTGGNKCSTHSIKLYEIYNLVYNKINKFILDYLNNIEDKEIKDYTIKFQKDIYNNIEFKENEILKLENENEKLSNALTQLYLDKLENIISEDEFSMIKCNLNKKTEYNNNIIFDLKFQLDKLNSEINIKCNLNYITNKYSNKFKLTREIINDFIDYIEVGEKNEFNEQYIKIYWNF